MLDYYEYAMVKLVYAFELDKVVVVLLMSFVQLKIVTVQ